MANTTVLQVIMSIEILIIGVRGSLIEFNQVDLPVGAGTHSPEMSSEHSGMESCWHVENKSSTCVSELFLDLS